jgi:hypothetical protein
MDFDFVTARLATGAKLTAPEDVNVLAQPGITHIIDCRDDFNDAPLLANHPNILYLWNGVPDDGRPKPTAWFQKSLAFGLPALAQPKTKLYCHCAAGINRGPSTAYAILIALGLGHREARAMIIAHRPKTIIGVRYADDAEQAITALGYV